VRIRAAGRALANTARRLRHRVRLLLDMDLGVVSASSGLSTGMLSMGNIRIVNGTLQPAVRINLFGSPTASFAETDVSCRIRRNAPFGCLPYLGMAPNVIRGGPGSADLRCQCVDLLPGEAFK
jgi:hypothetical protein